MVRVRGEEWTRLLDDRTLGVLYHLLVDSNSGDSESWLIVADLLEEKLPEDLEHVVSWGDIWTKKRFLYWANKWFEFPARWATGQLFQLSTLAWEVQRAYRKRIGEKDDQRRS